MNAMKRYHKLIESYTKLESIKKLIEKWKNDECLVCHNDFNDCGCHYDIGDAYIEEIIKIIEQCSKYNTK